MSLEGGGAVLFFNNLCYGTVQCYVHLVGFYFWMCNLFNLYYLLVLFHLIKVFVSIAFVSLFLSLFIVYFNRGEKTLKKNKATFPSQHKLDGSSLARKVTLLCPRTITGEWRGGNPRRGQNPDTHARSAWHKRNNKQIESVRGTEGDYYIYWLEGSRNKIQRIVIFPSQRSSWGREERADWDLGKWDEAQRCCKKESASACTTASLFSGEAASFHANTPLSVPVQMRTAESEAKG